MEITVVYLALGLYKVWGGRIKTVGYWTSGT